MVDRFRDESSPVVFEKDKWTLILADVTRIKVREARKLNKPVVKPHEKATDKDRTALSLVCIWKGDSESATFLHLINSMCSCVGR